MCPRISPSKVHIFKHRISLFMGSCMVTSLLTTLASPSENKSSSKHTNNAVQREVCPIRFNHHHSQQQLLVFFTAAAQWSAHQSHSCSVSGARQSQRAVRAAVTRGSAVRISADRVQVRTQRQHLAVTRVPLSDSVRRGGAGAGSPGRGGRNAGLN